MRMAGFFSSQRDTPMIVPVCHRRNECVISPRVSRRLPDPFRDGTFVGVRELVEDDALAFVAHLLREVARVFPPPAFGVRMSSAP